MMRKEWNHFPDFGESAIAVYPNPVQGSAVQLVLALEKCGDYDMTVLNVNGQVMEKRKVNLPKATVSSHLHWTRCRKEYMLSDCQMEK
jgi:hypothetical protein